MDTEVVNKEIVFASYPKGRVSQENFQVKQSKCMLMVKPGSKDILLKSLWVSLDPYMRNCMVETNEGTAVGRFHLGKPIKARTVSKVIASDDPSFIKGDIVLAMTDVAEYTVVHSGGIDFKIDPSAVPPSYNLGILGFPGHTAWVGLNLIGQAKPEDQVYITAAAGAVGLVAGQLAKLKGCRVVGSAGTDEKVRLLKEEFGFDDAFNYKTERDWDAALKKYFPSGIDIYFENVGGRMLEAVLNHINMNGRIPVCGMVSQYNQDWSEREGVRNLLNIVWKCVRMEGFLISHHRDKFPIFVEEVGGYIRQGKLKYKEYITEGLESVPEAFIGMMKGENIGKTIVHVDE